jgi:hypothetical protein
MKKKDDLPKIVKTKEGLLAMQICTSIPPEEKDTINDELRECGLSVSGTTAGWVLDETVEPVECADYEGRWHYICVC